MGLLGLNLRTMGTFAVQKSRSAPPKLTRLKHHTTTYEYIRVTYVHIPVKRIATTIHEGSSCRPVIVFCFDSAMVRWNSRVCLVIVTRLTILDIHRLILRKVEIHFKVRLLFPAFIEPFSDLLKQQ